MKLAISAVLTLLLFGTNTGCCLFCCRPCCEKFFGCGGCCDDTSCDSGCGERYWGDWPEGQQPCDQCGNWTGSSSTTAHYARRAPVVRERSPEWVMNERGERVVPGSYKVTVRSSGGPRTAKRVSSVSRRAVQ